jgi:hypothetical protein
MLWLSLYSHVSRRATRPGANRLRIEALEDRTTPAPFTAGDLVAVRVGDGSGALTGNATATFLDEFTTGGVATGNSVALPTATGSALTLSGNGSTEGFLSGSVDGHSLTLAGYNQVPGSSTSGVPRVIGVAGPDGSVDISTQFPSADAGTVRAAASADGLGFWVSTSNFIRFVPFGNPATTPSTALSPLVSSPTDAEVSPAGQLYLDGGAGAQPNGFPAIDGPGSVGTGLPVSGGQSITVLNGFPTQSTHGAFPTSNQFVFSPDGMTIYVADGRTNGDGGLLKYQLVNPTTGQWAQTASFTFMSSGLRGLIGDFSGSSPVLYATTTETSGNKIVKFVDGGSSFSETDLATAPANEGFRGIAFSPVVPGSTASNVSLTASSSTGSYGSEPTFTATVTGSGATPTGWVSFQVNGVEIGAAPVVSGVATLNATTNLPASSSAQTVVAVYTGNATYAANSSTGQAVTISQATPSTAVTFSANPVGTGANETITATVSVPAATQPTGTVDFFDGGTQLNSTSVPLTQVVVNQGGSPAILYTASFTTTFSGIGSHTITATYNGDTNFAVNTSPGTPLSVVNSTTTTVTTDNPVASPSGDTIDLTATVASDGGTPAGTVQFYDDLLPLGNPVTLDGTGAATITVNTNLIQDSAGDLTPGLHSISVIYTPASSSFFTSTGVYEQTVAAQAFGTGDIFIERVGDGTTPIIAPQPSPYAGVASIGNTIYADEYTTAGVLVQSIILPTADGTGAQAAIHAVVSDGQQSATGQLTLSGDGQSLWLVGYDSNPLSVATAPELHYVNTTSRAVARIGSDGTVQTIGFAAGSSGVQTGGNINAVYSPDSNQFYVGGFNGVDYFASFNPTAALQSATARIASTNWTVVGLQSDGTNLIAIGGSGTTRTVGMFGTGGFPTTPTPITNAPGFPGASSVPTFPVDGYFTHLGGPGAPDGINTFYIGDDGPGFARGTITKWSLVNGSWTLSGTITADGTTVVSFYYLAGQTDAPSNTVTLYATYGQGGNANIGRGDLYQIIDAGGWNQPFSSSTVTTVATVNDTSLENFRGVAFAPNSGGTGPGAHSSSGKNGNRGTEQQLGQLATFDTVAARVITLTTTDSGSGSAVVEQTATTATQTGGAGTDEVWALLGTRNRRSGSWWGLDANEDGLIGW